MAAADLVLSHTALGLGQRRERGSEETGLLARSLVVPSTRHPFAAQRKWVTAARDRVSGASAVEWHFTANNKLTIQPHSRSEWIA